MRIAHSVRARVFSQDGEDEEAITNALLSLFPFDVRKHLTRTTATGVYDQPIVILELQVTSERETTQAMKHVIELLSTDDRKRLLTQKEKRLDENLRFYFRLAKPGLLSNDIHLTDDGNCVHFTIHIATYPRSKSRALALLSSIIET